MAFIILRKKLHNVSLIKIEANSIYNTMIWRKLRQKKLSENPLCEDCLDSEIITKAIEVHHITPFMHGFNKQTKLKLAYDFNNLKSLCLNCHYKLHHLN